MAALGLSLVAASRGYSLVAVFFLAAEPRLQGGHAQSLRPVGSGAWAQ